MIVNSIAIIIVAIIIIHITLKFCNISPWSKATFFLRK